MPVLDRCVQRIMLSKDIHTIAVVNCMQNLALCYTCLVAFDAAKLDCAARKMASLYCSLEKEQAQAGVQKRWKVKPKLHLSLELCHF